MCAGVNRRNIEEAIAKRKKYRNIYEFLEAEARSLGIVREGDVSYLVYMPYKRGIRCHCWGKIFQSKRRCHAPTVSAQWDLSGNTGRTFLKGL